MAMPTKKKSRASLRSPDALRAHGGRTESAGEPAASHIEAPEESSDVLPVNGELAAASAKLEPRAEARDPAAPDAANGAFQDLLQSKHTATIFLDSDLHIDKVTAAATELFRLIDKDIGRSIGDVAARFMDEGLENEIRHVMRAPGMRERPMRLADHDGWYLMRISPYRTVDHVVQGVAITFVDISELERSRAQAALLGAIVRSSTDAIFTESLDGKIASWNRGAERMYGWKAEEMIGRSVAVLTPPELQEQHREIIARVQRGEDVTGVETTRLRKDGSRIEVSLTCSPVIGALAQLAFISVIARDITPSKAAERELHKVNEALRQSNEDLQHLTYAASHDLQEPLRMIANYAQLLSGTPLDERCRALVASVENGARKMHSLLRGMKAYWTIERQDHEPTFVESSQVFENALDDLKGVIEETGAEVLRGPLPRVFVHEAPLMEVFQNLVGNALKYRREGVRPRIEVGARPAGGAWEFSIADNGIGISPKHREIVFLPFKRLHGDKIAGAGMGLAICSRIIKHFGGRIWIESDGSGSTFRFTLPAGAPS